MTRKLIYLILASLIASSQSFAPRPRLRTVSTLARQWMAVQPPIDEDEEGAEESTSSKEELYKQIGETMRKEKQRNASDNDDGVLDRLNPFKAGQNLRKTIDKTLQGLSAGEKTEQQDSLYYLNDRLFEDGGADTSSMSLEDRLVQDDYVPEVLVVGATGEVGSLVVRRLLQEQGRFRVRVLVRDLYTRTLNRLGTGVTYCQGDLNNVDSLEYALTDVDKIIFCANPPKPDEDDFRSKFKDYVQETLRSADGVDKVQIEEDAAWERLDSVLQLRAELAEQVDCVGMKNVVAAYQHVRHADYGTSQAAKRTLFKFEGRPQDFEIFSVDQTSIDNMGGSIDSYYDDVKNLDGLDVYDGDVDEYSDYYDSYSSDGTVVTRRDSKVQTQTQWLRNKFGHAVFVGRFPKTAGGVGGGEAAIVSSRFRSRSDPDEGIDLSSQFSGMIARVCADGGVYEAFVRTGLYTSNGIEYVCEFSTNTKASGYMKSRNKFSTIRLPFEKFQPVARRDGASSLRADEIPVFQGRDIQYLGFRYRSASNTLKEQLEPGDNTKFYLSFSYVKLYRAQPEPEFVYVSDARIPPIVKNGMVKHENRQLVAAGGGGSGAVQLLDDKKLRTAADRDRTEEEVYYKFRGEEILKNSGLSYTIIRVMNYNESPSGEASTIDLKASSDGITDVSRAEVAQVAVSALMDPKALNKSVYMSKKAGKDSASDEDLSAKFSVLPADDAV